MTNPPTPAGERRSFWSRVPSWLDPLLILAAAALVFLPRLGEYGLHDPWETHYGEVARNMLESGDWISPWWGAYWPEGAPCTKDADCPEEHLCRNIRSEYLPHQATCRPKEFNREGEYFFSKPVLSMWMMALGMAALGVNEWGVRLPFVLFAIGALLAVWFMVSRLFGRRQGLLAALVMLTMPLFFLISRQAVTDGPFVTTMTMGLCFYFLGMFGEDRPVTRRWRWIFCIILVLIVLPQALLLAFNLKVYIRTSGYKILVGVLHGGAYLILLGLMIYFTIRARSTRQILLWYFYLLMGLSSLAKGILGFALPGAIILLHLVVTWNWRLLRRAELPRGALVFAAVAFPWYGAMFARHLVGFFDRFFIHDHFKRLAAGVHHLDEGGFEYITLWLGLGIFPWLGFLPAALAWLAGARHESRQLPTPSGTTVEGQASARWMIFLWFLVPFLLFALSSTKFHHYVYPVLPPAALATALFLDRLVDGLDARLVAVLLLFALGVNALVAWNLIDDPQRLVNLFTYKYDREWPNELDYAPILAIIGLAAALPLAWWLASLSRPLAWLGAIGIGALAAALPPAILPLFAWLESTGLGWEPLHITRLARGLAGLLLLGLAILPLLIPRHRLPGGRWLGLAPLILVGLGFGIWSQVSYMYELSSRWSQAQLFGAYRLNCTPVQPEQLTPAGRPVCQEPLIAYKMNWRGETFYSENRVVPLLGDAEAKYYLKSAAGPQRFYAIVEYSRLHNQFRPLFPAERWKQVRKVFQNNTKFVLLEIPAAPP